MQQTTPAILLGTQRCGEHSLILHAYTQVNGRTNYLVYGIGGKHSKHPPFAPMSLMELTADIRPTKDLPTLKESHLLYVPQQLDTDIRRQTVAMFIAEVLFRTLRYPMQDNGMFEMLTQVMYEIDTADDIANVHIRFLVRFASQLGLTINKEEYPDLLNTPTSRTNRQALLSALCNYYHTHLEDWQEPKSLEVLREVFD